MNEPIVIISGSHPIPPEVAAMIPESSIVIAIDGGIDHALAAGLVPSGLIGDLDSVSPDGLAWAEEHATIARHPADKTQTDTELGLSFAVAMMPSAITLVGGGDRLDHTIAALGALGARELTGVPAVDAWWDGQHIDVIHGPGRATLQLRPGSTVSLLALTGPCEKVSIQGVRWELERARLEPVVGVGISNEVLDGDTDGTVEIQLSSGVLFVFDQPRPAAPTTEDDA